MKHVAIANDRTHAKSKHIEKRGNIPTDYPEALFHSEKKKQDILRSTEQPPTSAVHRCVRFHV